MFSTINDYFLNAQLSLAAYANLFAGISGTDYVRALEAAGMSPTQARELAGVDANGNFILGKGYTIVDQQPNTASGFSATVFRKNDTPELFFAIRGTEPTTLSDLSENIGGIGGDGIAIAQTIDMFNYYQKLTARTGQTVYQYVYNPLTGTIETSSFVAQADGKLVDQSFTATGHSLGGHLAMVLSRLVSNEVQAVFTYNAPGFDPAITNPNPGSEAFLNQLRDTEIAARGSSDIQGFFNTNKMTHLIVPEDLVHNVGIVPGNKIPLFTEISAPHYFDLHDIKFISDVLGVYDLLARIAPAIKLDDIGSILKAASNKPSNSLENALDSLRKLFQVNGWQTKTTVDDRQAYYTNLFALQDSISQNGVSNLTLTSLLTQEAGTTLNNAQANDDKGLATRYALKELNPFVLSGNAVLYAPFGEALKVEHFSDAYLTDRVAFLYNLRDINIADSKTLFGRFLVNTSGEKILFNDLSTRTQILFTPQEKDVPSNTDKRVIFGSDAADNITGQANADRIYGGDGNDILSGNDGDDYLEGNLGNDRLYAGMGNDTYVYLGKEGNDTIIDSDGFGKILYSGRDLSGAKNQVGNNTELFNDGTYSYRFLGNLTAGGVLTITKDGDPDGKVTVENFKNGNLGITLNFQQAAPTPIDRTIVGDFAPFDFDPNTLGIQTQTDDLGNLITDPSQPGARDDTLVDSAGNDHILSGGGNDRVQAFRGGNDWIQAGAGRDAITAGAGNDRIEGGADADILDGGDGNDQIYADTKVDLATAITQTGQPATSGQGDFLTGGAGDDTLVGSNASDALFGGAGSDILVGGAGDDYLDGDADFLVTNLDWTRVRTFQGNVLVNSFAQNTGFDRTDPNGGGDDVIYGGDGNDDILGERGDDYLSGDAGDDVIFGGSGDDVILGGTGNDILNGDNGIQFLAENLHGDDFIDGGDGDDQLFGEGGNDTLFGGAGDDTLSGGKGNDVLYGGPGNDILIGGEGKDTYVFNRGDGTDFIFDTPAGAADPEASVLMLGPGISDGDIKFRIGSLEIDLGGGDAIHFEGFNPDDPLSTPVLDSIQFADGTQLSYQDVLDRGFDLEGTDDVDFIEGTAVTDRIDAKAGNDTVIGKAGDDTLLGGAGDDVLQGDAGNDTLEGDDGNDSLVGGFGDDVLRGGEGNDELLGEDGNDLLEGGNGDDYLVGGSGDDMLNGGAGTDILTGNDGSDIYLFASGDGQDTVDEQGLLAVNFADTASTDVIRFAEGILPSAVALLRVSNGDLLIRYGQGDQITVKGQYAAPGNAIERIEFADGTVIGKAALDAISIAPIEGTAGNDVLEGTVGDDTLRGLDGDDLLDGGAGNDRIEGGAGTDTYLFYRGMGSDTLVDAAPAPDEISTLKLEAGLTLDSIKAQRRQDDLFVGLRGTSDGVLIKSYYDTNTPTQHWQVALADGTVILLQDVIDRPDPLADVVALSAMQDYKQGILSSWNAESQAAALPTFAFVRSSWSQTVTEFRQLNRPSFVQVLPQITSVGILDYGVRRSNAFTPVSTFQHTVIPSIVHRESDDTVIQTIGTPSSITNSESHKVSLPGLVYGGSVVNVGTFSTSVNTTNTIFSSIGERWTPVRLDSGDPVKGVFNILHSTDYRVIEEITAGDSANTINGASGGGHIALIDAGGGDDVVNAGPDDFVYGNDGNDQVYGGNIVYGGNGDDYLSGGTTLNGGAGNDTLTGGAFMAGGAGDDSFSGQDGATVFFIDPSETGQDAADDTGGTDQSAFNYAYYRSVGVADPGESEQFGGRWGVVGQTGERLYSRLRFQNYDNYQSLGEVDFFYTDSSGYGSDFDSFVYRTQDDLRAEFNNLGFHYQAQDIRYIQPLPPAPEVKATEYALLEPFVASGVIEADTVKFGDGLSPNDVTVKVDSSGDFLNFSWGQDHGLQVALAADEDAIGTGIERYAFSDGMVWTTAQAVQRATQATEGDDLIFYTRGSDVGSGLGGNDQLYGNAGDDVLSGGAGDDILDGGAGNDTLSGGTGSDTYVFNTGDGVDHIINSSGEGNSIQFGAGITPDMLSLGLGSLAIHIGQDGDTIHLDNFDPNNVETGAGIDDFRFADGTSLTYSQLLARGFDIQGSEEDDFLSGTNIADRLTGFGGNDFLDGAAGDDVLDGGAGDDMLDGGSGDDVLDGGEGADVLIGGAGNDTISDTGGIDKQSFDDLYYNSIGIFEVDFRRENGGRYVDNDFDPNTSFATPEEGRDFELQGEIDTLAQYQFFLDHPEAIDDPQQNIFGFTLQEFQDLVIQQQQRIDDLNANYLQRFVLVEPLLPAPDVKATDYAALESFIASGLIEADTVQFGDGLNPNDVTVRLDPSGNFLNFSWDQNNRVQVAVPSDTDLIGTGIERFQFADGTVWSTAEAIRRATQGTEGNDVIYGSAGDNVLTGGAGNDTLIGGAGADTYVFNLGDGVDHIQDSSGTNSLLFGEGITPDSVTLGLGSLLLRMGPSTSSGQAGDEIHIDDFNPNDVFANPSISNFQFDPSPGSGHAPLVLSYNDLIAKGFDLTGTAGDDTITGTNANDRFNGLGGDDVLNGGEGDNTYVFDPGFGHDVVINPSGQGSVQFTNGIAPGDITVSRDALDLLFTDKNGNQVRVSNWYADANSSPIQQATFADGTMWDAATLDGKAAVVNDAPGLTLIGSNRNDVLSGGAWDDVLLGGKGKDILYGGVRDDLLNGGKGNDVLKGDGGNDILEGGNGKDVLKDKSGNNLLNGGKGNDSLTGGNGNELFIGGKGNDSIITGKGHDIIVFNRGDGIDTLDPSRDEDNTLSLGGGIRYEDLALSKNNKGLIVEVGNGEKITLKNWYASTNNHSVLNLQVITDAMTDYDPNSSNPLLNKRVNDFDFAALVDKFDQAKAANKNLAHWSVMNNLLDAHLATSDTEALGGDLAYQYGKNGTLAGMGMGAAQDVLNAPQFGAQAQTLRPLATLQEGAVKLG